MKTAEMGNNQVIPSIGHTLIDVEFGGEKDQSAMVEAPNTLKGRSVKFIREHAAFEGDKGKAAGGGFPIASILLIAGGIMYAVCKDEEDNCPKVAEAGEIMMIVGGAMIGLVCCCAASIFACAAASKK